MKKTILILFVGTIIYLSGCKVGPDFQRAEYNGPDAFRFDSITTDTVVNLRWWELFNDDDLDTLIKTALNENKDVLIAAARIEASRANLGYTKSQQWPSFGYAANAGGGKYGGGQLMSNNSSNFSAYPEMYWEIGFWGKYRRMNESARAELLASEYGLRTVQISLISAVASTYFTLLEYKAKLNISKKTLTSRQDGLDIIQSRFDYGVVPEIDLNQAQIQKAISAAAVPVYTRAIAITEIFDWVSVLFMTVFLGLSYILVFSFWHNGSLYTTSNRYRNPGNEVPYPGGWKANQDGKAIFDFPYKMRKGMLIAGWFVFLLFILINLKLCGRI